MKKIICFAILCGLMTFSMNINAQVKKTPPELMNKAFTYSKKHMVKLECSVSISSGSKSNYADLEAFAHYLNPDIFCLDNMFLNKIVADTMPPAIMNSIKRISRYVGTRPYVLINNVGLSKSGTKYYLNPNISIGNFGTALFYVLLEASFLYQGTQRHLSALSTNRERL